MGNGNSVSKIAENKSLRTIVLISTLILSVSSIFGTFYSVKYGVNRNTEEIIRVEKKVDASYIQAGIVHKELYSNDREYRDHVIKDEAYNKMVEANALTVKVLTRDLGEIKGDVKVLLSRSNQ